MTSMEELRRHLHDLRGALSVIDTFVRHVDPALMHGDMVELHEATMRSMERAKNAITAMQEVVRVSGASPER